MISHPRPETEPPALTTAETLELTQELEAELGRMLRVYSRENNRCSNAGAYLAACALAGAELETALILTVNAFSDEAIATGSAPRQKGQLKPLLEWKLGELLRVAKAAAWLPSRLELSDTWDGRKAKIGDYAEIVRQLRNLLHPARYIEDFRRKRVTEKQARLVDDVLHAISNLILQKLYTRLRGELDAEPENGTDEGDVD